MTIKHQSWLDNHFPGLFSSTWEELFNDANVTSIFPKTSYPYDVVQIKDKEDEVKAIELRFALAGFSKEDVKVKVIGDKLKITTHQNKDETPNETYLQKGIAKRDFEMQFILDGTMDSKNVKVVMKNGMLKIRVPKIEENIYEVEID